MTVSAAIVGCAVEIAGGIEDQAAEGNVADVIQNLLRPTSARCGGQLEHIPQATAVSGRAVEIAGGIEDQGGVGNSPIRAVEAMQHLLRPASARRVRAARQLEHRPETETARVARAVEIAEGIEDQPTEEIPPVRTVEAVQHFLRPSSMRCVMATCQLEHRPVIVSAAIVGRAVEIAGGIEDEAGVGNRPIRAVEAMQQLLRPTPVRWKRLGLR